MLRGKTEELKNALLELARVVKLVREAIDDMAALIKKELAEVPWHILNLEADL